MGVVPFFWDLSAYAVDFKGKLPVFIPEPLHLITKLNDLLLSQGGRSHHALAFLLENFEAIIDFGKGPSTAACLSDNGIDVNARFLREHHLVPVESGTHYNSVAALHPVQRFEQLQSGLDGAARMIPA